MSAVLESGLLADHSPLDLLDLEGRPKVKLLRGPCVDDVPFVLTEDQCLATDDMAGLEV